MKRQRANTFSIVLAMLCASRGRGLRTHSAFLTSMSRPQVKPPKRSLPMGALGDRQKGAVTARWRYSTTRPAVGVSGPQRTRVPLPMRDTIPLSTLDRHSSSLSPQHPQEPNLLPVARSADGHLRKDVKIHLTKAESKLFATLLQMVKEEKMGTTLRVAGGWVRDKLVGQEQRFHQRHLSKVHKMDIDIALDNCMGGDFAQRLGRYLAKSKGVRRTSKVAVIASNPEKSKHLETATIRVDNFWVDFVNLRTESYLQDSRIPSINIGTPMEDAFRRDLTINSLFYNVNTGTVEDYTGKGTSDLRLGLVRTPLPPAETLLDDPLRVLRAVRFASRLGFKVHPELIDAGSDPRVHEALRHKVSRERVGCELDQMVRSAAPLRAFQLMDDMNLLPMVFPLPEDFVLHMDDDQTRAYEFGMVYLKNMYHLLDGDQPELNGFNALIPESDGHEEQTRDISADSANVGGKPLTGTKDAQKEPDAGGKLKPRIIKGDSKAKENESKRREGPARLDSEETRRLALYAAFMLPLADSMCVNKKGSKVRVIQMMMADQLKLRAKDPDLVMQLLRAAMDFQILLRKTVRGPLTRANNKTITLPRLAPGLTMRSVGPLWRVALLLGITGDLGTKHILANRVRGRADREEDAAVITAYVSMARAIEGMGLDGVWDLKPMFDGRLVKKILPNLPSGPVFSEVMSEQISWMIENPQANEEDGREFLQARFASYT